MAKRSLFRETATEPEKKVHAAKPVAMSGQEAWVNTMVQANEHVSQFLDRQAQQEGKEAGIKQGKEFEETGGTSLYDRAYDAAGRESYKAAMGNQMAASMSDIYRANKHDPKVLQEKLDSYQRSLIGSAEEHSPEAAIQLESFGEKQKLGYLDASRNQSEAAILESAEAEATAGIQTLTSTTQFMVRNMRDRESAMTMAAHSRAQLEAALVSNGKKEAFADEKSLFLSEEGRKIASEPSADRSGVFSAKQIQLALKRFDDTIITEKYMWGMDEAIKAGKPLEFYRMFIETPNPLLTADQSKAIKTQMKSAMSEYSSMITSTSSAETKARIEQERLGNATATTALLNQELTDNHIKTMQKNGDLSASDAISLTVKLKGGGPIVSNDHQMMVLSNPFILARTPREDIELDESLTFADRQDLLKERDDLLADQDSWMSTPSGRDGERRISMALGIKDGIIMPGMKPALIKRAGEAVSMYIDAVNQLPVEQRRYKSVEIAENIIKTTINNENQNALADINAELSGEVVRKGREPLPYSTEEELDDAIKIADPLVVEGGMWNTERSEVIKVYRSRIKRLQSRKERLEAQQ